MKLYATVENTTWPVNVGETNWKLRYAPDDVSRLHATSIVAAYAHLTDPLVTQKDAIAALKRARKAMASAGTEKP